MQASLNKLVVSMAAYLVTLMASSLLMPMVLHHLLN